MNPNREEALFALALEKPIEKRAAFLDAVCEGEPALRQRLEALLAAHEQPDGALPTQAETAREVEFTNEAPDEAVGQTIGRYKLLEKVGEGGCGVVYVAEQTEPVRRRVALKVIKLGMDTKQVVARFEAERQALAMMDHPNIAKVLDAGTTDVGGPYFVMELVRGIRITDYCDQNNLSTKERLDLFIKVCQAIQHAHQKGIIHRDIKPSNILVTLHDGVPVPKVIDFGIAKATEGRLTDATVYTQLHQFIGTPAYMSPEQAEMSGLDIDTRSDIYSLGVLLYELLAGSTPFDAKELLASGIDAMRKTIREEEPVRPSTRLATLKGEELTTTAKRRSSDPPKLIHLLKGDLDWIVMKCLEKDRTRRYDTANGLAMDLRRHLSNEPVVARPPSAGYRFQKAFRRNKLIFTAATAVALALILGMSISVWQAARATRSQRSESMQRRIADQSLENEAQLRVRAQAQELEARRRAYASDINLAQQALALNNLGRAQELLERQRPQPDRTDLRGWEWRYLWQNCRSDALFTLCQRSHPIMSLSVSHDGKWLAIGEEAEGALSIWDVVARREISRLPAGKDAVFAAFSPREPVLAFWASPGAGASSHQYFVRLWDVVKGQLITNLPVTGSFRGLAFSNDGRTLVTSSRGSDDQPAELARWRVSDGQKLSSHPALGRAPGVGIPFAMTGDLGFSAHELPKGGIRVLDPVTGKERWTAKAASRGWIESLAFSPDGRILASSSGIFETDIRLWGVTSGREIKRLAGHRAYVVGLAFSPDGRMLASASADQTIGLWDLADLENVPPPRLLRGHRLEVWRLAFLPDNRTLVSGSKDGSVCFWDTTAIVHEQSRLELPTNGFFWAFTADSQSILAADATGRLTRWRWPGIQEGQPLLELGASLDRACISEDQRLLAAGFTNGIIALWDLHQRALIRELGSFGQGAFPKSFLAQGQKLVVVKSGAKSFHEWDLSTWTEIRSWKGPADFIAVAFSADERWCLMIGFNGEALLKDLVTGVESGRRLNIRQVQDAAFSPDGRYVAAASSLGFARLWDATSFAELATFRGFLLGVDSVAFSPDSKRIAVSSAGKEAFKLWDVESGEELLTLEGLGPGFDRSAFSPDGSVLGATAWGRTAVHFWTAPSWEQIASATK